MFMGEFVTKSLTDRVTFDLQFYFFPTFNCHPIKVTYLSVALSISRWMINMYIKTGIQCQLRIDRDVSKNVTFKLKWWHSISNCLVPWHVVLFVFRGVRLWKNNNCERRNYPKGQINNFVVSLLFLVWISTCQSLNLLIDLSEPKHCYSWYSLFS